MREFPRWCGSAGFAYVAMRQDIDDKKGRAVLLRQFRQFDGEGMIMSLFQRIKSMLGLSEATVPPPASKPTPAPMAPKAIAPTAPTPAAAISPMEPAAPPEPAAASTKPAPMSPEIRALLAKGRADLKEENIAAAKESFDAVLAIDPENEAALKLSGLSAIRLKKAADQAKKAAAAAAKG